MSQVGKYAGKYYALVSKTCAPSGVHRYVNMIKITYDTAKIAAWVSSRFDDAKIQADFAIGSTIDEALDCGLVGWDYTGTNIWCHIVIERPCRVFLVSALTMVFETLGVKRVSMLVYDDNFKSIQLMKSLGAQLEYVLKDGHIGGDLLLYVLWKDTGIHKRLKEIIMGTMSIVFVVRDKPHPDPRFVRNTVVFKDGSYETPDGVRRNILTNMQTVTANPPTYLTVGGKSAKSYPG